MSIGAGLPRPPRSKNALLGGAGSLAQRESRAGRQNTRPDGRASGRVCGGCTEKMRVSNKRDAVGEWGWRRGKREADTHKPQRRPKLIQHRKLGPRMRQSSAHESTRIRGNAMTAENTDNTPLSMNRVVGERKVLNEKNRRQRGVFAHQQCSSHVAGLRRRSAS